MKAKLISLLVGSIVLIVLCHFIDIGTVANYIQVLSAIPWFYTIYRIEDLHRKHNHLHEKINARSEKNDEHL